MSMSIRREQQRFELGARFALFLAVAATVGPFSWLLALLVGMGVVGHDVVSLHRASLLLTATLAMLAAGGVAIFLWARPRFQARHRFFVTFAIALCAMSMALHVITALPVMFFSL